MIEERRRLLFRCTYRVMKTTGEKGRDARERFSPDKREEKSGERRRGSQNTLGREKGQRKKDERDDRESAWSVEGVVDL